MEITVSQTQDQARIVVSGEIDERGAEELKHRFSEVRLSPEVMVVFDFEGVKHIGSAGIGKLLLFYKAVASHGGRLHIERASTAICELLHQLKLDTIISIARH